MPTIRVRAANVSVSLWWMSYEQVREDIVRKLRSKVVAGKQFVIVWINSKELEINLARNFPVGHQRHKIPCRLLRTPYTEAQQYLPEDWLVKLVLLSLLHGVYCVINGRNGCTTYKSIWKLRTERLARQCVLTYWYQMLLQISRKICCSVMKPLFIRVEVSIDTTVESEQTRNPIK